MPDFVTMVSVIGVVCAATWAGIRHVNGLVRDVRGETSQKVARLHERLDRLGEVYMRRDETLRHLQSIERQLGEIRKDVRDLLNAKPGDR